MGVENEKTIQYTNALIHLLSIPLLFCSRFRCINFLARGSLL